MLTILFLKYMIQDANGQIKSFRDAILIVVLLIADLFLAALTLQFFGIEL